jgi:hypothetical protein
VPDRRHHSRAGELLQLRLLRFRLLRLRLLLQGVADKAVMK